MPKKNVTPDKEQLKTLINDRIKESLFFDFILKCYDERIQEQYGERELQKRTDELVANLIAPPYIDCRLEYDNGKISIP